MKANKIFILFAFACIPFFSCSRDNTRETVQENDTICQLGLRYPELDSDTKTQVGNVNLQVVWVNGDAIALFDATENRVYKFELDSGSNGKQDGEFNLAAGQSSPTPGHDFYAIYPYDAVSLSGSTLKVEVYPEKDGGYVYGGAKSGNEAFALNDILVTDCFNSLDGRLHVVNDMNRLVTLLAVNVTISDENLRSEIIKKVTFKATGISGIVPVTFSDGKPQIAKNAGTKDSITLTLTTNPKMSASDYVVRFIPLLPVNTLQSASNLGLTILLDSDNYEVGFHRNRNQNLNSGANNFVDLFEGLYTNLVNSEAEAGTTHLSWWHVAKTDQLSDESDAGTYRNSTLPGSGAGSYGEGAALADE